MDMFFLSVKFTTCLLASLTGGKVNKQRKRLSEKGKKFLSSDPTSLPWHNTKASPLSLSHLFALRNLETCAIYEQPQGGKNQNKISPRKFLLDIHISRHLSNDLFRPTKSKLTYFIPL